MVLELIIFLITLCFLFLIFFIPFTFKNFEISDKRSLVNAQRKLRKYGAQVPPPYPNGWFAIEQSRNLKPGTSKSVDCLGENFVVFRSKSNEVFVLDAYCPHMGANLGVGGMVKGNCIECPFHAWIFSGETGECLDIPYSESCDDVKKQAKIKKWISKEANGFIYVWYHAENEEPWELPVFNFNNLGLRFSLQYRMYTHVQDYFENAVDLGHLPVVHSPSVFAGKKPYESSPWFPTLVDQNIKIKWTPDAKNPNKSTLDTDYVFKRSNGDVLYTSKIDMEMHGPGIQFYVIKTALGDMPFLASVTPQDPISFILTIHLYSSFWLSPFAKFSGWSILVNLARDKRIWDMKKYQKNLLLVKEEKVMKEFKGWYSKFYSPNSKTYEEARNSLDW